MMMKQRTARLTVLLLLAALVVPSIGPLVDHHFAERQPGHRHYASASQSHTHSYQDVYHQHSPGSDVNALALVNFDTGPVGVTIADLPTEFLYSFEPTSYFHLPPAPYTRARVSYIPPPDVPPRDLL